MKYRLMEQDFIYINEAIREFPEVSQVILFGSRTEINHKKNSVFD